MDALWGCTAKFDLGIRKTQGFKRFMCLPFIEDCFSLSCSLCFCITFKCLWLGAKSHSFFLSFSLNSVVTKPRNRDIPRYFSEPPRAPRGLLRLLSELYAFYVFQPPTTYWSCVDHVKNPCLQKLSEPPSQLSGLSLPAPSSFSNGSSHRLQAKWIRYGKKP